jgi:hypothetical protein
MSQQGMGQGLRLEWAPPGPVARSFMASTAIVQAIEGPVGSGKTTTVLMKIIKLASQQRTSSRDGVTRKSRWVVVRDTYRQLWKTTMQSWFKRVPRELGEFTGSDGAPATHKIKFALNDGTIVDLQVDFLAIGENAVEDVLRGYEPTGGYLNEADLLSAEVLTYLRGRVGRFPDMEEGGPTWAGVLLDFNAPELDSWAYKTFYDDLPEGWAFFRQPSGFSPRAENLKNLPPNYYENAAKGAPAWYVARMLKSQPGYSRDGKPVFPEFVDELHVAREHLSAVSGIALGIGLDAGLHPAAVCGQRMPNGQWRILSELVGETGTGPTRFGQMLAQHLKEHYPNIRTVRGYADPSAAYGADKTAGEQTWIEIVAAQAAIIIQAAPTNALIPRLEAVRVPLTRLIDGMPGFLMSPDCPMLRKGFNSAYRYRKLNVPGTDRFSEDPEKNDASHPMDSCQYLLSGGGEDIEIRQRHGERANAVREATHEHEWDPLA